MSSGKYGSLIKQARKLENQNSGQEATIPDKAVNLSIKVPMSLRRHWVSEAKRQGTTLTAVITEALSHRFGQPETE
ncbi:MAG: hypothetical protein AAF572_12340 [Cyanobacteria bacterium P01_B01_bin.77]